MAGRKQRGCVKKHDCSLSDRSSDAMWVTGRVGGWWRRAAVQVSNGSGTLGPVRYLHHKAECL